MWKKLQLGKARARSSELTERPYIEGSRCASLFHFMHRIEDKWELLAIKLATEGLPASLMQLARGTFFQGALIAHLEWLVAVSTDQIDNIDKVRHELTAELYANGMGTPQQGDI